MSGTTPLATWKQTSYATQSGTVYPVQIDANFAVAQRFVDNFAPRAQDNPNMTVRVDAGHMFFSASSTLLEKAAQTTGTFSAPVNLPRIDRIVADLTTGVISVVTGTEASSPVAPALPSGKFPVAQIALQTSTSAITNAMLTDERDFGGGSGGGGGFATQATIASSSTTDLGSTTSNNIFISGNTGITSFGASASTSNPIYIITFGGALVLTHSAHLILPGATSFSTAANDSAIANYNGFGNWQILAYMPAVGNVKINTSNTGALVMSGSVTAASYVWAGNTVGTNAVGARTVNTIASGTPTGGANGDIVFQTG